MPKVGKVKLDELGLFTGQTTYVGARTIDLYYNFSNNKFSFKGEDIKSLGLGYEYYGMSSSSRNKLISKLEMAIGNCEKDEKYLSFSIRFDIDNSIKSNLGSNEILSPLTDFTINKGTRGSQIEFNYQRCIKKTTLHTNEVHYLAVDDDFEYDNNRPKPIYQNRAVFIPYTEQRELFLQSIVDGIKDVNKKLLDFVKNCENEDSLSKNIDEVSNKFIQIG